MVRFKFHMKNRRFFCILAALLFAAFPAFARAAVPVDPLQLADPFVGTSTTPDGNDVIDDFPGADVPFGMVQWSPDTPSQNAGGGYEYKDHDITGFSLTHLAGPGCSVFGDFGILPVTSLPSNPGSAKQPFSHITEQAAPGWYAVTLGAQPIRAELTVTTRTGLGQFTFPGGSAATMLFNVSSDQAGVRDASVQITGNDSLQGSAATGGFCGMPDKYNVYFAAQFDRPFTSFGTWKGSAASSGSRAAQGVATGAWVSFDPGVTQVRLKVGLSFVSESEALANLRAEARSWDLREVRASAQARWRQMLGRIAIEGGTRQQQRTFYSALYHTMLHPNVSSDADGSYPGYDNRVHHVRAGHMEYANFSDWDIYRTEMPLIALLAPAQASDMAQSLVDAAHQDGFLPRWALVNGATSVMGGDSVDPVIAGAYAFGGRDFDVRSALAAMVKGATQGDRPVDGWYQERPELREYLNRGYIVNTHTTSVSPVPNGASETLEYALDDFSIAQFAKQIGDPRTYRAFMPRSANWANLFDTATGWIAPRGPDGAFLQTPIGSNGQSGFQEGSAQQYTWMVPQDLHDLVRGMGGNAGADQELDVYFSELNAGQNEPYAWLGNEPSIGSPFVYLNAGEPWKTQQVVRNAMNAIWTDTPQGLPGNDDLGTMSAWYVWCAIGLYPQNPSVRRLVVASPLFAHTTVTSPGGLRIRIDAPQAAADAPYVHRLLVNGRTTQRTWIDLPMHGDLSLDFTLSRMPDLSWGAGAQDAPPSYAPGPVHFVKASTAQLVDPGSLSAALAPGDSSNIGFIVSNQHGQDAQTIHWSVRQENGLRVEPSSGTVRVDGGMQRGVSLRVSATAAARSGYHDLDIIARSENGALLPKVMAEVFVLRPGETPEIGYIQERFDNTITPIDPATGAIGPDIPVGQEPRDAVITPQGTQLYVADRGGQSVTVIDTRTQQVTATVAAGHSPDGLAVSPDGKTVWVANYDDGTIQPIDTSTNTAGTAIAVGKQPRYIAATPDGSRLYVTNEGSNNVTPIDVKTKTALTPIPVGQQPSGIAITPDGRKAYVVDYGSNDVTPIDLATGRTGSPIPVGISPVLIAVAPNGSIAYVGNFAGVTVTPIDIATNTARPAVRVGGAPYGIAFTRDSKTAYVVIRRDNAVVPVDVATASAGQPIHLGTSPYTIALP
jgi:predicted alpha-1,2-mannosidase